jgi:hypothetical protein
MSNTGSTDLRADLAQYRNPVALRDTLLKEAK